MWSMIIASLTLYLAVFREYIVTVECPCLLHVPVKVFLLMCRATATFGILRLLTTLHMSTSSVSTLLTNHSEDLVTTSVYVTVAHTQCHWKNPFKFILIDLWDQIHWTRFAFLNLIDILFIWHSWQLQLVSEYHISHKYNLWKYKTQILSKLTTYTRSYKLTILHLLHRINKGIAKLWALQLKWTELQFR